MKSGLKFAICTLWLLTTTSAYAQSPSAPAGNFKAELIYQINDAEKKLVTMAEAIPAEKYDWKPAEGVRTVREVFLHVAGGCYGFAGVVGVAPPKGFDFASLEATTGKENVIAAMKRGFQHARATVEKTSEAAPARYRGQQTVALAPMLSFVTHMNQHLGQMIAYARSLGIIPPWSQGGT